MRKIILMMSVVHPIVVGQGKPMFQPSDAKVSLQFAEARTFGKGSFSFATTAVTHKAGKSGILSLTDHEELRPHNP